MTEHTHAQAEQERVTQADIDFVNEFWRLSANWGSMEDMRELALKYRLAAEAAQKERDAAIAEGYPSPLDDLPMVYAIRHIAQAIRSQNNDG